MQRTSKRSDGAINTVIRGLLTGASIAAFVVGTHTASAANQTWNLGGPTNNWNLSDANWDTSALWINDGSSTAVFNGTGEAIDLTAGINAAGLTFGGGGYSIGTSNSSFLTLTAPTIAVTNSTDTAIISSALAGTSGLSKAGAGTLTLSGVNTYTGGTIVKTGTLNLDFSTNSSNILDAGNALTLAGGTLSLTGASATNSQTVAGLTLNTGGSSIVLNQGGASTLNLALGGIVRNAGGTVKFTLPTTGSITTTNGDSAAGAILGTWASVGSGTNTKYAKISGGSIAAFDAATDGGTVAATGANLTSTTGLVNYDLTSATGTAGAGFSANTIRYTGAAATTTPGTGFTVNGLMNAGTGLWTIGTAAITIGADKELVVNTANNDIAISSVIQNNAGGASGLTKTGTGTLSLSGVNTYTGATNINSGVLTLGAGGTILNTSDITIGSGATLNISGSASNQFGNLSTTKGALTINGTLNTTTNVANLLSWSPGGGFSSIAMNNGTLASVANSSGYGAYHFNGSRTITATGTNTISGSGVIGVASGTVLTLSPTSASDVINVTGTIGQGTFGNSGGLTKAGLGTVNLTGANGYTGATSITGGTLTLGVGGRLTSTSGVTIDSGTILNLSGTANNQLLNSAITSTLAINGTLNRTTNQAEILDYFSTISMDNGTLSAVANSTVYGAFVLFSSDRTITATGTNTISGTGVIGINSGRTLTLSPTGANDVINVTGTIGQGSSGTAGGLTKAGLGTVNLTGANGYTGATRITGGTLTLGSGGSLTSTSSVTIDSGTTLNLSGGLNQLHTSAIASSTLAINGTLNRTTAGGAEVLDYFSTISMNNGTLSAVTNSTAYGAFLLNGSDRTITATGTNTISGTGVIGINSGRTLTLSPTGANDVINVTGTIGQGTFGTAGGIAKSGLGTVTLSGANNYTGATSVTNGALVVNGSISGSATINGGTLGGRGATGTVTLTSGTLAPGDVTGNLFGKLSTGDVTFGGGTFALDISGTTVNTQYDQLNVTGLVSLTANIPLSITLGYTPQLNDSFTIVNNDGTDGITRGSFNFTYGGNPLADLAIFNVGAQAFQINYNGGSGNDVVLTAVPEPAAFAALLGGAAALLGMRRRRR